MEIQEYIKQKKELYELLLKYIDDDESENAINFENLINFFEVCNLREHRYELKELLYLILNISQNHHRGPSFFNKIEQVISYFENEIKQTFTNSEILDIFYSSRPILLYLLENKIILPDLSFIQYLIENIRSVNLANFQFFIQELQHFLQNESQKEETGVIIQPILSNLNNMSLDGIDEKRKQSENDSYICTLIRNDSIEEFVAYVNKTNFPLSSTIAPSIYETNPFLIKRELTTLIEYSAFFGSMQIFQYLRMNRVQLKPSLWLYAIHGNNPELIHLLEQNNVRPYGNNYNECLKESIKCHHNYIANYLLDNFIKEDLFYDNKDNGKKYKSNTLYYSFKYYNHELLPFDIDDVNEKYNDFFFYYACEFDYYTFVNALLADNNLDLNKKIILKHYIFTHTVH